MIFIRFHLGRRQVVMVLMDWAIDVPRKLLQSDAKPDLYNNYLVIINIYIIILIICIIRSKGIANH